MAETGRKHNDEPLIRVLRRVIGMTVRVLAVLMTVVIVLAAVDVGWTMHQKAMEPPRFVLTIPDILATFGAFMAVLIAIEIFFNIILYLREDVIHVKIVIATALMAIARKVIILDFDEVAPIYVFGIACVVIAMSVSYWIVNKIETTESHHL
jgi:uncharacterized membrane protein (DUF373 family)